MKFKLRNKYLLLLPWILTTIFYQTVVAQESYGFYGNPYSSQLGDQLNHQMQQSQLMINQSLLNYERENTEELQAKYQQLQSYGIYMPYQQFVYFDLMSSGGRNPQAVIKQQRGMVDKLQGAHQALQDTYDENYTAWLENQQALDRMGQESINSIQGVAPYYNPYSNQTYMLPYDQSGYYSGAMGDFFRTPEGQYYQEESSGFWDQLLEVFE